MQENKKKTCETCAHFSYGDGCEAGGFVPRRVRYPDENEGSLLIDPKDDKSDCQSYAPRAW